jgi:hypothetical protein
MNLCSYLVHAYETHDATKIINFIQSDTSTDNFDKECTKFPGYVLDHANYGWGWTALAKAVEVGNIILTKHIITLYKGDCSLFLFTLVHESASPLHLASKCEDPEKGYLAAKTLVQMGSPVNITRNYTGYNHSTPLDYALCAGNIKIASFLLRQGGISFYSHKNPISWELAKKESITEGELLFKMFWNSLQPHPYEVGNIIVSYMMKLDLV